MDILGRCLIFMHACKHCQNYGIAFSTRGLQLCVFCMYLSGLEAASTLSCSGAGFLMDATCIVAGVLRMHLALDNPCCISLAWTASVNTALASV